MGAGGGGRALAHDGVCVQQAASAQRRAPRLSPRATPRHPATACQARALPEVNQVHRVRHGCCWAACWRGPARVLLPLLLGVEPGVGASGDSQTDRARCLNAWKHLTPVPD